MTNETTKAKRSTRGMGSFYLRNGIWWICYRHGGKRYRESSESTKRPVAVALMKRRFDELGKGRPMHEAQKITLADLKVGIEGDYGRRELRSGTRLKQSWARIEEFFGEKEKAVAITSMRLKLYVAQRIEDGVAPATIKTELAALKRAFNLARKDGILLANEVPSFPTITTNNARQGWLEEEQHEAIRKHLGPDEGDVAHFLFWTGWRKGEALGIKWKNVDEKRQEIRIETSKNGEPRVFPYGEVPALVELIERRRKLTDAVQKERGMIVAPLFHRNGEEIKVFRRAWISACIAAGLGKIVKNEKGKVLEREAYRIPHDYRRSFARNMSRHGVGEAVIMKLAGWKTRSVFDRYRIVPLEDLKTGLAKFAAGMAAKDPVSPRVEPIQREG